MEIGPQPERKRVLGSKDVIVDAVGPEAAFPLRDGFDHCLSVLLTQVGHRDLQLFLGLRVYEARVRRRRKLTFSSVCSNFMAPRIVVSYASFSIP